MRRRGALHMIPAHGKLVSELRFESSGEVLFSSSYDRTVKAWSMRNGSRVGSLYGHEGLVMGMDVLGSGASLRMVTTSFDRMFKVWEAGSLQ